MSVWYVTGCDRCGKRGWNVKPRPDLPCCPVPLCDECAETHRREVEEDRMDKFTTEGTVEIGGRGTLHIVRAPRDLTPNELVGATVLVDGIQRVVTGVEHHPTMRPVALKGESVGLLLRPACEECGGRGWYWTEWSDKADRDPDLRRLVLAYPDPPDGTVCIRCHVCNSPFYPPLTGANPEGQLD